MRFGLLALFAASCFAQTSTLRVFSEFTRIDPFGQVIPQDRGTAPPRDILSPGFPRGAFSSLRIAVTLDKAASYILDIGQNPENAVKATLYKERFEKHGDVWIPDGLEPVKIPYEGTFVSGEIPGQTTITFWLDMWVDPNAPVDRIKVEPQLWVGYVSDWFTYPMEARILSAVLPPVTTDGAVLPPVSQRSDAVAMGPLRAEFCGEAEKPAESATNARALIRRNVLQHQRAKDPARTAKLLKASGSASVHAWCAAKAGPAVGPEWYLKLRDSVLQRPADAR